MSDSSNINTNKIVEELYNLKVPQSDATKNSVMASVNKMRAANRIKRRNQLSITAAVSVIGILVTALLLKDTIIASSINHRVQEVNEKFQENELISEKVNHVEINKTKRLASDPTEHEITFASTLLDFTKPQIEGKKETHYVNSNEETSAIKEFMAVPSIEESPEAISQMNISSPKNNISIGQIEFKGGSFFQTNELEYTSRIDLSSELSFEPSLKWIDYPAFTFTPETELSIPIEKKEEKKWHNYFFAQAGISAPFKKHYSSPLSNGMFHNGLEINAGYGYRFPNGLTLEAGVNQMFSSIAHYRNDLLITPGHWNYDLYYPDVTTTDFDGDGLADGLDFDDDGSPDYDIVEGSTDSNGDGVPDYVAELAMGGSIVMPPPSVDSTYIAPAEEIITTTKQISVTQTGVPLRIGYTHDFNSTFGMSINAGAGVYRQSIEETIVNSPFSEMIGLSYTSKRFVINPDAQLQFNLKTQNFSTYFNFRVYQNSFDISSKVDRLSSTKFSLGFGMRYGF
ncbi:MAG: hypothetical protein MK078_16565 [Crocinitomicaceae bacterium]|nr:hypothetical protein [Crocinitomicaceae bacterium]